MISNSPAPEPQDNVWRFAPTQRISTYITALIAGPYHSVHSTWEGEGRSVPLGIYCRPSLAEHLDADAIFEVTRQASTGSRRSSTSRTRSPSTTSSSCRSSTRARWRTRAR